jgi:hypothetical protein
VAREVDGRLIDQLPVHIRGQRARRIDAHARGLIVVDRLVLHEVPTLEGAQHAQQVAPVPPLDGVHVQRAVVDARLRGDRHAAAVEAPVPHRDLQEAGQRHRRVVAAGEGARGRERLKPQEGVGRGEGIGQRPDVGGGLHLVAAVIALALLHAALSSRAWTDESPARAGSTAQGGALGGGSLTAWHLWYHLAPKVSGDTKGIQVDTFRPCGENQLP